MKGFWKVWAVQKMPGKRTFWGIAFATGVIFTPRVSEFGVLLRFRVSGLRLGLGARILRFGVQANLGSKVWGFGFRSPRR